MQNKLREEMIEKQKKAVSEEVEVLKIQLAFKEQDLGERETKAKTEEEKTMVAKERLQHIEPIRQNIAYKEKYHTYLCSLDTESAGKGKQIATSKAR